MSGGRPWRRGSVLISHRGSRVEAETREARISHGQAPKENYESAESRQITITANKDGGGSP